jgi:ubiquinone/menaquinone biosynthesis C-methylase UbiE
MKEKEINLSIINGYNLWSETYDSDENPLIYIEEKQFLKLIGNVKNKEVLDVGCGTGRITLKLLERGAKVCGIDINSKMLQKAKEKNKKIFK